MKRTAIKRGSKSLKADPQKTREWQDRSRAPLSAGDRLLKRTEMTTKPSAKKKAYEAELDAMRPIVHSRSGGRCEARLPGCEGVATNIHHRKPRGLPGTNAEANLMDICGMGNYSGCHGWIETNRTKAYELGLLVKRSSPVPTEVWKPLKRIHRRVEK